MANDYLKNRILILGNGPSLKKEYFSLFENVPCLGMNAAYRYWQRISWYPDIYCCLDDQVVLSHADAIADMMEQQLCKHFFLHPNFLQRFPSFANAQGVYFLPQLRLGQNNKDSCEKLGLDYFPQDVFRSKKPGKLTTGSYAVRFAAFLGYRQVGLIGIDCRYTEVIKEAKTVEGIVLEIGATPNKNTNYFFDDYQLKGDRYNIPNPEVHQGNLHLQAFEALRDDIQQYKFDLEISICSPESEIYDKDVFSYVPLTDFVTGPNLSAIFIPYVSADVEQVVRNIARWGCQEFAPYRTVPSNPTVELHLAYNLSQDPILEDKIADAYFNAGLHRYFAGLYFHYSNLEGLRDLYTRQFEGPVGPEGYMAGPNNQFFDIIEQFSVGMSHVAILEADCVPIRANWLDAIEDIILTSDRFWICGSHYRGVAQIQTFSHINGNAIYNVGDTEFRRFFRDSFLPYFYQRVKSVPSLCYDIVLHDMFHSVFTGKCERTLFHLWGKVAHRFRFSEYIVDVSHASDRQPESMLTLDEARGLFPDAYLLHGAIAKIQASAPIGCRQNKQLPTYARPAAEVVMLDPDALGHIGHYLAYDDQINKALTPYGGSLRVLANRQLPESIARSRQFFVPWLSDHSWTIGLPNGATKQVDQNAMSRFEQEVEAFLQTCFERTPESGVRLYMYCAGIPHAQVISRLIKRYPTVLATVNLFYLPFLQIRSQSFKIHWVPILKELAQSHRLSLTLPTDLLADDLQAICGIKLPVTPHPSPTISDRLFPLIQNGAIERQKPKVGRLSVLFPGAPSMGKGQDAAIAAANLLASTELNGHEVSVVLRDARKKDTPRELAALYDGLDPSIDLIKGQLSNEEFLNMFLCADIIVLPYTPSMFRYRNSGLLVDAIYCGKPVVAVKDTWLGNIVERERCGMVVPAPSPKSIVEAIRSIASDIGKLSDNARAAARSYFVNNSWELLSRSLLFPGNDNLSSVPICVKPTHLSATIGKVIRVDGKPANAKQPAPVITTAPTTSPAAKPMTQGHASALSSLQGFPQKPAVSSPVIARPKPNFVSRLSVDLGQPIEGTNWSAPTRVNGLSARSVASGQRATLALSLKRDHDLLLLLMLPPRSSREPYDGVRLEIDGTVVPHTLHLDIEPPCVVARVPAKKVAQDHVTELALLVSSRTEPQGVSDGPHTGFAVAKVSVIPSFPTNFARALTVGKPWYQRVAGRLGTKPLAFPFSHFDGLAYVAEYPDVAEAILGGRLSSGLRHYQRYGRSEGRACVLALKRNPSIGGLGEIFDGRAYLETYPDIAEAVRSGLRTSALEHYIQHGRKEGRRARLLLDGKARRGTAAELAEWETLRTAQAATDAIKVGISKDVAKQVGHVSSELTRLTSVLQAKLEQVTKEQSAQQGRQAAQAAEDLARTTEELRGDLALVTEEQAAHQAAQAARVADGQRGKPARKAKKQGRKHAAQLVRTADKMRGKRARKAKKQSLKQSAQGAGKSQGKPVRVTKKQNVKQVARAAAGVARTANRIITVRRRKRRK